MWDRMIAVAAVLQATFAFSLLIVIVIQVLINKKQAEISAKQAETDRRMLQLTALQAWSSHARDLMTRIEHQFKSALADSDRTHEEILQVISSAQTQEDLQIVAHIAEDLKIKSDQNSERVKYWGELSQLALKDYGEAAERIAEFLDQMRASETKEKASPPFFKAPERLYTLLKWLCTGKWNEPNN